MFECDFRPIELDHFLGAVLAMRLVASAQHDVQHANRSME